MVRKGSSLKSDGYLSNQAWGLILVAGLFSLLIGGLENYTRRHRPTP